MKIKEIKNRVEVLNEFLGKAEAVLFTAEDLKKSTDLEEKYELAVKTSQFLFEFLRRYKAQKLDELDLETLELARRLKSLTPEQLIEVQKALREMVSHQLTS